MSDLLLAVGPRQVTVINPQDATGAVISAEQFRRTTGAASVKVLEHGAADALPLD